MKLRPYFATIATALFLSACSGSETHISTKVTESIETPAEFVAPDWTKDAVIYQINTRQYSEAGNFAAVEADLDRIKSLGVDIVWLMPIHPIGEAKRKGTLGSPYAVKDYQAVNSQLGTLADFESLVKSAHDRDMRVIIDWVANHTAWDNHLIAEHPDWYTRNADGEMQHPPDTDWYDVADLDYSQPELWDYMEESLLYWVRDVGVDGYRCDVAGMVPTEFWKRVRPKLDAVKPVFLLAEWQDPELHEAAFHASYAWRWKEIMQEIAKGNAPASAIKAYYEDYQTGWPEGAMRMTYTENHDQNTWDGSSGEIYGEAFDATLALSFVGEGIPLIYNGQEAGNQKRLEFFEKDLIEWKAHSDETLIKSLIDIKTENEALWNGTFGARMDMIKTDNGDQIFAFTREKGDEKVLAIFNLSDRPASFNFEDDAQSGTYRSLLSGESVTLSTDMTWSMSPWDYRIYSNG